MRRCSIYQTSRGRAGSASLLPSLDDCCRSLDDANRQRLHEHLVALLEALYQNLKKRRQDLTPRRWPATGGRTSPRLNGCGEHKLLDAMFHRVISTANSSERRMTSMIIGTDLPPGERFRSAGSLLVWMGPPSRGASCGRLNT
jgi:hypothetical protein